METAHFCRIDLFGGIRLVNNERSITHFRLQKAAHLLAYLALDTHRTHLREHLVDLFWPELDSEVGRDNLSTALTSLRRAMQACGLIPTEVLRTDRQSVGLNPEFVLTDIAEFDTLLTHASSAPSANQRSIALEQALQLYRGDLLEGCYEDWALLAQNAYRQRYQEALIDLARDREMRQQWQDAQQLAERALQVDALQEQAVLILMRAQAQQGRIAAALTLFEQFRQRLQQELDAEPTQGLYQLAERLQSNPDSLYAPGQGAQLLTSVTEMPEKPGLPAPAGELLHNLPHWLSSFVGRHSEIEEVQALLQTHRLLTLTGMGGSGKTRLATEVASQRAGHYPEGVWMVELASLSDPALVPEAVAQALQIKEQSGLTLSQSLIAGLKGRRLLLLMDNCEHLIAACAQLIAELVYACPSLQVLATSREPLLIAGEQTYAVPLLTLPASQQTLSSEGLLRYEAIQLFVERAQQASARFVLTPQNLPLVVGVCQRLEGIPLALELAAARLRSLSLEELSRRLEDPFNLLRGGDRTALPRQQTLRALIDWSYELLSVGERLLLCRLSVFMGGWTLEAAEAVCSETGEARLDVLEHLTSLVDKSLVLAEEQSGVTRYRMLETVRQYALERLGETEERQAVRLAHSDYFVQLAEVISPQLVGKDQSAALQALDAERDNLRQAIAFCSTEPEGAEAGLRLASALCDFWRMRSYLNEGRRHLMEALEHPGVELLRDPASRQRRATALSGAGTLAHNQGDYATARAMHEQSLSVRRELDDRHGIARCLNNLGNVAMNVGDITTARAMHEQSLSVRRELGDKRAIAGSLGNLATLALDRDDFESALTLNQESLALFREAGDLQSVAHSLNNLANTHEGMGNYGSARAMHEESLEIKRELGDRWGEATSLLNLANVALSQGDLAASHALLKEGLDLYREMGDRQGIAYCLEGLGVVLIKQGDALAGQSVLEECLEIDREIGYQRGISFCLHGLGCAAYSVNDYTTAETRLRESLAIRA